MKISKHELAKLQDKASFRRVTKFKSLQDVMNDASRLEKLILRRHGYTEKGYRVDYNTGDIVPKTT